jgi:hypothetical protein
MNRAELLDPLTWRIRPPVGVGSAFRADPAAQRAAAQRLLTLARCGADNIALRGDDATDAPVVPGRRDRPSGARPKGHTPRRTAPTRSRNASTAEIVNVIRLAGQAGSSHAEIVAELGCNAACVGTNCSRLWRDGRLRRFGRRLAYRYVLARD